MTISNRLFLFCVVILSCIGCDQATKKAAEFALKGSQPMSFFGNMFRLEYAENTGAFLGLGSSLGDFHRFLLLTVVSSIILLALGAFVCFRKDLKPFEISGYSLILAGGVSNMIDRIMAGAVIDFMNIGVGSLRTGIFNIADMAIMAGLFLVVYAHLFMAEEHEPKPATTAETP
jgi:signal peptidase II